MVDAKGLRIGNFVRCSIYNGNKDVIIQFTWQEAKYIHLFDEIPLSEEWLLKLGFELEDDNPLNQDDLYNSVEKIYGKGAACICKLHTGEFKTVNFCDDQYYNDFDREIKYVHQLQNYVYARYDIELTIKE